MHQLKWIEQRVETRGNLNKISGYASTEMDRTKSQNRKRPSENDPLLVFIVIPLDFSER